MEEKANAVPADDKIPIPFNSIQEMKKRHEILQGEALKLRLLDNEFKMYIDTLMTSLKIEDHSLWDVDLTNGVFYKRPQTGK